MSPAIFTPQATVTHPGTVPYISCADYQAAATGVDTSQLVPSGDPPANLAALASIIRRASGWADAICYQILAATLDTQTALLRVRRDGTARVPCDFWPVLELDSFSAGPRPSALAPVTNTQDIWLQGRKVLVVPVAFIHGTNSWSGYGPVTAGSEIYAQWTYWNGWPCSTLMAAVVPSTAAPPPLTVAHALPAATAGQSLTIYDGASTETVTVGPFTGGTSLPLGGAGCTYAHTPPAAPDSITVTALPERARQAVISLTSCLVKTRGVQSFAMPQVGQSPSRSELMEGGGLEDYEVAVDLLQSFSRTA